MLMRMICMAQKDLKPPVPWQVIWAGVDPDGLQNWRHHKRPPSLIDLLFYFISN